MIQIQNPPIEISISTSGCAVQKIHKGENIQLPKTPSVHEINLYPTIIFMAGGQYFISIQMPLNQRARCLHKSCMLLGGLKLTRVSDCHTFRLRFIKCMAKLKSSAILLL